MSKRKSLAGNLILLLASITWGLAFSFQKIAAAHLPPFTINLFRFLLGAVALIPFILIMDRTSRNGRKLFRAKRFPLDITKKEMLGGVLCGVALMLAATLQQISLSGGEVSPGKASFITALYVVFVPVFGLFRKKHVPINVWGGVVLSLFGAYLLTADSFGSPSLGIYDIVLFISSATFALHITVIDIFAPHVDGARMSMIQFFTVSLLNIPFVLFVDPLFGYTNIASGILEALPSLLYLGLLSCGLAYTAQVIGQQLSGTPTVASLIMSLESVFGLIGGILFLEESLTPLHVGGGAVILVAVVLAQLPFGEWIRARKNKKSS